MESTFSVNIYVGMHTCEVITTNQQIIGSQYIAYGTQVPAMSFVSPTGGNI